MKGFMRFLVFTAAAALAFAQGNSGKNSGANQGGQWNQTEASDISNYTSGGVVDVIVQFKQSHDLGALAQVQRFWDPSDRQEADNELQQGQDLHNLNSISAFHLKVPSWAVPMIAAMPSVKYVSPVRPVQRTLDIVDATVFATMAWNYGWDGSGVGVAVIDSGVYGQADDFSNSAGLSRVVYSESFITGMDASDQYGHGTHVAGIIGADGKDSIGLNFFRTFKGVAPNVNLVNLRVLDANGAGQESNVIAAIQRAIQLKSAYNIRIINLSLGRPIYESYTLDPLCQAVEAAWKAGIVVVAAAGNSGRNGYGTIIAPGNDPYVITVGATRTNGTPYRWDDSIASYSSKGPTLIDHVVKPDLVAPGNGVVSVLAPNTTLAAQYPQTLVPFTYYENPALSGTSGSYFRLSGTSMATPVVSGAAALLIQQNPNITPDQVKARLMKTAGKMLPLFSSSMDSLSWQQFFNQSDIFTVGAGYLDITAALRSNELVDLPALSPTAMIDPNTGRVIIMRGGTTVWGTTDGIVWGDVMVWGSAIFTGQNLSGYSTLWGDNVFGTVDMVVWGDSLVGCTSLQAMSANDSDQ